LDDEPLFIQEARKWANMPWPTAPHPERDLVPALPASPSTWAEDSAAISASLAVLPTIQHAGVRWSALDTFTEWLLEEERKREDEDASAEWVLSAITESRLHTTFTTILAKDPVDPAWAEEFFSTLGCNTWGSYGKAAVLAVLRRILAQTGPRSDADAPWLQAFSTYCGACGPDWETASATLTALLDHPALSVRACAAYQLGVLCESIVGESIEDMTYQALIPPEALEELVRQIAQKEQTHAGVATGFWNAFPRSLENRYEWLLDVLCSTSGPEAWLPYYPCNMTFHAHEYFSQSPEAVSRLIDAARYDVAIMTATEEHKPVPGMEQQLCRLATNNAPEIAARASRHLADYYQ